MEVLTNYHQLHGHFHNLKTNLEREFQYPKKGTSHNIDNLQCAVNLQQTYTSTFCANVNNIYSKLAQLEAQIQMYCIYPHPSADTVQLEAPNYDFDIDGPQGENNPTTTRVTILVQGLSSSSETLSNSQETEDNNSSRESQYSQLQENTHRFVNQSQHCQDLPEQALFVEASTGAQASSKTKTST